MKVLKQLSVLLLLHAAQAGQATTYHLVATGNWSDPSIWSPAGVPAAGDDVYFTDNGNSRRLTLTGDVTVRSLHYDGDYRRDTLNGSGTITLTENSTWIGGWIAGQVKIIVPAGKTLGLNQDTDTSNRKCLRDNAQITNHGTMVWQNLGIFFYGSPLIHNLGTFIDNTGFNRLYRADDDSSANFFNLGFINDGTFVNNSQELTIHIGFINNGTVNIQSGWAHGDMWVLNNGSFNLNASGQQSHQFFNFISKNGTLHFGTNTTFVIANTQVNGGSSLGTVTGSSGTLAFGHNNSQAVTAIHAPIPAGIAMDFGYKGRVAIYTNLTVSNSGNYEKHTLGNGRLILAPGATLTWKEGILYENVDIEVGSGATLNLINSPEKGLADTSGLVNHGTVNFQGGTLLLQSAMASIQNHGAFRLLDNSPVQNQAAGGTPVFQNHGLLEKSAGSSISQLQMQFVNASGGIIAARSGIIQFIYPLTNQGRLEGNATFAFTSNQPALGGTIAPGDPSGTLSISGGLSFSGTLEIGANGSTVDKLQLGGQLVLSLGCKLKVVQGPGTLPANSIFTMVQANGNISGTFTTVEFPCAGYQLSYTSQQARLQTGATGTGFTANNWTGATGTNWSSAANWSSGMVPSGCHDVEIPGGSNAVVQQGVLAIAHTLTVAPGGLLEVELGGELTVSGD